MLILNLKIMFLCFLYTVFQIKVRFVCHNKKNHMKMLVSLSEGMEAHTVTIKAQPGAMKAHLESWRLNI
jgi:hypothetical protein